MTAVVQQKCYEAMRISNNISAIHNLHFNVNMMYFLNTMHWYVLSVLVQMVEMLHSIATQHDFLLNVIKCVF